MPSSLKALVSMQKLTERVVPSHLFALIKWAWSYSPGVSHSFCDPIERDHDDIALTLGWSDLDQDSDPDTSVCLAAHGRQLRPDAVLRLQWLWDVPSVDAVAG